MRPLDRVGCYVPGGRYPLPSSLLMTAIPARVAGVAEIIAVCPRPEPVVLAAAEAAGVTRLFQLGGAHAIAALAFGTSLIPRVDRIVGPGNKYVAAAKTLRLERSAASTCRPDRARSWCSPTAAGPRGSPPISSRRPSTIRTRARSSITSKRRLAAAVAREVDAADADERSGPALAARRTAASSSPRSRAEAVALANRMAPEHLVVDDEKTAAAVGRAGAIFIGEHTAQVAGDYAIGSNHVLPTGGAARFRGGLHAADYRPRRLGAARDGRPDCGAGTHRAHTGAAEGLTAHAQSMIVRDV